MATYHITHTHSFENCFSGDSESMDLWRQIPSLANENNVTIHFFKVNPTEHIFSCWWRLTTILKSKTLSANARS